MEYIGQWDELSEQCKTCVFLRCMSVDMGGDNTYVCGKYPLKNSNEICPKKR